MRGGRDIFESMYGPRRAPSGKAFDWKRVAALFAPYAWDQTAALAAILIGALLGLIPGYAAARIINIAIPHRSIHELAFDVIAMVITALLSIVFSVLQAYYGARVSAGVVRDIRSSLVAHVHRMPLSFFTRNKTGEINNRVSGDVDNIESVISGTLSMIVSSSTMIVTTLAAMFIWNWRLALISVAVVPLMLLPIGPVGRRMYDIRKKTLEQHDTIGSMLQETLSISGITLVKTFVREASERLRFHEVATRLLSLDVRLATVGAWFMASVAAMVIIGPAIIWLGGGLLALRSSIDIGVLVAFVGYVQGRLYGPAASLAGVQAQVTSAMAVFDRIFEYLDLPIEAYDVPNAISTDTLRGDVRFEDVGFSYHDRQVLRDISFHVRPGQVAAFVGPSGAGKSTIVNLVARFYDAQAGRVLIDDVDVREIDLASLRRDVGIVTQETYLFHDTIENNLRYAKPDATPDELVAATSSAQIHDFIVSLPDGYDTVVGERGLELSGGERQRLAIARVLLKNPRILILDEATSALDAHSEAAVQKALEIAMRGRTSLVVAHRFSTIVNADLIVVVEKGRIAEVGKDHALSAANGLYASMRAAQFRDSA